MNENLCKDCDNFMFTYTDEEYKLYNCCKQCGNMEQIEGDFVYKTELNTNISNILNTNEYILNDITLPKIINNTINT